ncbi:MAG: RHS repeat-associated core domain-containing protein [Dehalococcoidia bacterium]|nr:RHS repeat-associated core domain-containing protein [Dehalococcoidia bacterium]
MLRRLLLLTIVVSVLILVPHPQEAAAAADSDLDSFGALRAGQPLFDDDREAFMVTDSSHRCAETATANDEPGLDAWPFDFNDDQLASLSDVLRFIPPFNSQAGEDPYDVRFDLNTDSRISLADVFLFLQVFNESCADPAQLAVDLPTTTATDIASGTQFLYTGVDPIQPGVAPGTIEDRRVAVLRGRVQRDNGQALPDVLITVLDHPEFGETQTRRDGMFDMALNGGGPLTISYQKDGFMPLQRQENIPWRDYVTLDDVVMIPYDLQVTSVDLTSPTAFQVAQGSAVSDADGTRQSTLLFPAGTTAEMVLADGSTQPLSDLSVRATEYTVGEDGPERMPAALPPTSGYTYAVELSVDQAVAAGATDVRFSQPLYNYVENFIGFPVGGIVPAGYYDRDRGVWVPSDNGRVVKIVTITSGLADLDTDGDGAADNDPALGVTDAERERLANLYTVGQSLWRVPITHFTPWDYNWPYGPPGDAEGPPGQGGAPPGPDKDCESAGSTIECQNQTLGERIAVTGTPFSLNYRSDRTPGRDSNSLEVKLSEASVPASLERIDLELSIAGQVLRQSFPPQPNQTYTFTWDGKDAYGRTVQGGQPVAVSTTYVYPAVYLEPEPFQQAFALMSGSGTDIVGDRAAGKVLFWNQFNRSLGRWDARGQGLGGWTLDAHHTYDLAGRTLYLGNGERVSTLTGDITTVAGNGSNGFGGDGGPATQAALSVPHGMAVGADGSLYIADSYNSRIRRVGTAGIITTVAGNGSDGFGGDGGPATQAALNHPSDVAVGADGSLYIADYDNLRIRRVGTDGIITTVAGNGSNGFSGDGGPATQAALWLPNGVAVGADGSLYIADSFNHRIRRVGTDGIISTVAGNGTNGFSGDGGPATQAALWFPHDVAVGADGSLYIADNGNSRIRRVGTDGIITTVAGNGTFGFGGDGGPATQAAFNSPVGVAVGADGSLYIPDFNSYRIRVVTDGIISTVAGGTQGFGGDGGPATQAALRSPYGVAVGADGSLYIADAENYRIRKVLSPLPAFAPAAFTIPSLDGREVYQFNVSGRHLRTLHGLTSAVLYEFGYDGTGRLTAVTDGDGNVTTIERDTSGKPTAIVGPFGQRTDLTLDPDGYLASVTNPAGEAIQLGYGSGGLLTSLTDPGGNPYTFVYDANGRLTLDQDPAGGSKALSRTDTANGYSATLTTALGRTTNYELERLASGGQTFTTTQPAGASTTVVSGANGSATGTFADGTAMSQVQGPDPRWGMLAPLSTSLTETTPGGLTKTFTSQQTATLADPNNPLSLQSLTSTSSINGRTSTTVYDNSLRRLSTTSPAGRQTHSDLDPLGRVIEQQPGAGVDPLSFTYDAQGRMTQTQQGNVSWTFAFDSLNRLSTRTDAAGNQTSYSYDGADRLTQLVLPSGRTYGFAYDANGNRTSVTMATGAVHQIGYTTVNLDAGYTPPGNPGQTKSYDIDRSVTRTTLPGGRMIDNSYDSGGRLSETSYAEATNTFTYAGGTERPANLTRTPAGGGAAQGIAFTYDGQLVTGATWTGPAQGQFQYSYDNNFFLTGMTLNSGTDTLQHLLTRDTDGLVTDIGPFTITRSGPGGAPAAISDGTSTLTLGYDSLARTASRDHVANGQQAYNIQLTYDNVGRVLQKVETVGGTPHTYAYTYDADDRVVQVQRDATTVESYGYDLNGNRTSTLSSSATYDTQDRLMQQGGVAYQFNADGFLSQRGSDTFSYSATGELLSATVGGQTVTYAYDALGRRVARTDAAGSYQYLYGDPGDSFQITAARDPGGILTDYYYDDSGLLFALQRGGAWYYVSTDHLGTPRVVTDAAGTAVKVIEYDSFGVKLSDSNAAFDLPIGFAGGLDDTATGLVRFGFRDYDAASGRWTARDPALFGGGQANLYAYVNSNPVNLRDPSGLWCIGGSFYAGLGLGGQICHTSEGTSVCVEMGVGVGGGVSAGGGGLAPSGPGVVAEASASCAGVGVGVGVTINECGVAPALSVGAGPVSFTASSDGAGVSYGVPEAPYVEAGKCQVAAKVAYTACERF